MKCADARPCRPSRSRRLSRAAWDLVLAGLYLCAAPRAAIGQEVHGVVRAKGVGVAVVAADVRLLGADSTLKAERLSDDHGKFFFKHLEPGAYTIRVDAPGFARAVQAQVLVRSNAVVDLTAWLDPQPITIPKLKVEAHRRADEFIRQHIGMNAKSLNPADIAVGTRLEKLKVGSYTLSDVLHKQAVPGLVVLTRTGATCPQLRGRNHPICAETRGPCFQLRGATSLNGRPTCAGVYLDGLRVDQDMVWTIQVMDIGAIVVLEADEAGVLHASAGGVVLLYSKDEMGLGPGS